MLSQPKAVVIALLTAGLAPMSGCGTLWEVREPVPPAAVAAVFPAGAAEVTPAAWWQDFDDPRLDELVRQALAQNLSAAEFAARVLAARQMARQVGATRLPQVNGLASLGVLSTGDEGDLDVEAGLGATWEVDLFGRIKSRQRAAVAEALAAEADLAGVRLAVAADLALAYYRAVEQRLLLDLLAAQIERDRTLLELIELRFAQGGATSLDLLRQRAQLADAQSLVPPAQAELRRAENALDALLGLPADGQVLVPTRPLPDVARLPAVGVPSDLLLRRPDLVASRLELLAADWRIAEAVADRLPRLTLVGSLLGVEGDGGNNGDVVGSLVADVVQPLVDWGLRQAVVEERKAIYAALLAGYGNLFVNAVAEVDTLLFAERQQRQRVAVLAERVVALEEAVAEARNRYANGLIDYLDVLTAQNDLQETQRELLTARRILVELRIELYRAAGGGLGDAPPPEALVVPPAT